MAEVLTSTETNNHVQTKSEDEGTLIPMPSQMP
jgi:hypothetical protein